jgi:hypothetical protein
MRTVPYGAELVLYEAFPVAMMPLLTCHQCSGFVGQYAGLDAHLLTLLL